MSRHVLFVLAVALTGGSARAAIAQPPATPATFDETIPPGANFDKAEFRLWLPPGAAAVRAIAVLVPGSNGDGRPMAEDAAWPSPRSTGSPCSPAGSPTDVAMMFYEDVLPLRLGAGGTLQPMNEAAGFLGDLKARTIQPLAETKTPNYPTAWLPTVRVARVWQALVTEKPFEP